MAKSIELTLQEACQHPECFMYVWATNEYLAAIDQRYAPIILQKKRNQKKLLMLSADKYLGGFEKVNQYYDAIEKAFVEIYDMTPYKALIVLAQGGEVAGKNWEKGVYGIGELQTNWNGFAVDDKTITVDTTTGHIMWGEEDITDESATVTGTAFGKTIPYQLFSKDIGTGYIFMSEYSKTKKKYYAKSYSDGQYKYSAKNGKEISDADSGNIWGSIQLDWSWLKNILNWLLSIFGIQPIPDYGDSDSDGSSSTEMLTAANTLPSQKADGYATKAGMGDTGVILLCAAAAGYLLYGTKGKKKKGIK